MIEQVRAIPRWWPAVLSGLVAAIFGWGATMLPWRDMTPFALLTAAVAITHAIHVIFALLDHHLRLRAWRMQSLVALCFLVYVTWNIVSASTYIAALYGGLGKGVAAGLGAAWAVVAFLVLPLSVWGLAVTGGLRWDRRTGTGTTLALVLAAVGLWRYASLPEAQAALEPESTDEAALAKAVAAALPDPESRPVAPKDAPSLMVREAVECEATPGAGRVTVLATSLVSVAPTRAEAKSRCVQAPTLSEALDRLGAELREQALRGPIAVDVITGTRELEPVVPVVDAMQLRPGLDGVCEGTRCLAPWQLLALDQFNTFTPIPVIPDLRFGFDPVSLRQALAWPERPQRISTRLEGLRGLETVSFVLDAEGELHRLRRMRRERPPLDAAQLRQSVDTAERYILDAQGEDGRFEYKADPFTGQVTYQGFALARQAGTTLVVCELARDEARAREVARKALAMLVSTMQTHGDMGMVVWPRGKQVPRVGLGATALTSIALLSCRRRVGDEFDEAIGRMTRFLLHMQREDGGFHPELDMVTGEPIPGPDPLYAVGQAVFALTLLERLGTEESLPHLPAPGPVRAAVDAAMTYTAEQYWSGFASDFFFMEENWHCLAARASLGHHRHDGYERFCIDYTQYKNRLILDESDDVSPELVGGYGFGNVLIPHNTGSSGFGEAMSAAIALRRARGEDTTADEAVMYRALQFLVRQQWDEVSCFACATEPHSMVGAFSEHMGSPEVRIDFVQHAMAGLGHGGRMLGIFDGSSIPTPLSSP
jgi:hypothetical protein